MLSAAAAYGLVRNMRVNVTLVEAQFERPQLPNFLGLPHEAGFSDILLGDADVDSCLVEDVSTPGLYLLPGGTPRSFVPGEFNTESTRRVLSEVGDNSSYLLVDAPPVLTYPETRILAGQVDAVIVVIHAGVTTRDEAEDACRLLDDAGAHVVGTVLNRFNPERLIGRRSSGAQAAGVQ